MLSSSFRSVTPHALLEDSVGSAPPAPDGDWYECRVMLAEERLESGRTVTDLATAAGVSLVTF